MRFCITSRSIPGWPTTRGHTFQAGVTMPLWPAYKVKRFGPEFPSYWDAAEWLRTVRPR